MRRCTREIWGGVPGEECRITARCVSGLRRRPSVLDDRLRVRLAGNSRAWKFFDKQRRQMVAAIRANTNHFAAPQAHFRRYCWGARSKERSFNSPSASGRYRTGRVSGAIRNLVKAPTIGQVTAILPLRSGCMAAPKSPASLTGRPVMPAPQSNLIAPWLSKVNQQTMVANARARPTSGQTRSNAVNTTPHPCFCRSPSGDACNCAACPMGWSLVLNAL